jgi:hypothetical protein
MVKDVLYYTCRDGMSIEACGAASRKYEKIALLKVHFQLINLKNTPKMLLKFKMICTLYDVLCCT